MATSAFGKAFRAARAAGDKTFEFNGKKYTTQLASESAQPSVGGKVSREYKTRGQYSDRDQTALDSNYTRRDMKSRMDEIDRETQGDTLTAMRYKPRRDPGTSGAAGGDYMAESGKSRTVRNMYERGAEETNAAEGMKRGGKVAGYAKGGVTRADGCVTKGHTKGKMV